MQLVHTLGATIGNTHSQVLAEMEEEEAEEECELHAPAEARESPTVLMNAAGLLSAPKYVIGTSDSSSGNSGMYKPSTELQPGYAEKSAG